MDVFFEDLLCHGDVHDSDEYASDDSRVLKPLTRKKGPRTHPRIADTIKQLQAKGGFTWEDPRACDHQRQRKRPTQRPRAASPSSRSRSDAPNQSETHAPAAVSQEACRKDKLRTQQKSDETLPIWEDVKHNVAASLAEENDGGAIVNKIPRQFRLSFSDENAPADANVYHKSPNRSEAMKIATQQAAMREEAARAVLHSKSSQSFLPSPPKMPEEANRPMRFITTPPPSHSYMPAPPSAQSFSACPPSPRCLTFLPPPPPAPRRERSITPHATPRCQTGWPLESPRHRDGLRPDMRSSSRVMSPRGNSPAHVRSQSLSRIPSAVSSGASSMPRRGKAGPRRNSPAPYSARSMSSSRQAPAEPTRSSSRAGMSPAPSFIAGPSRQVRLMPSFPQPETTESFPAHDVMAAVKIAAYTQAMASS